MLMKLTPAVNFINIKCANFTYKSLFSSYVLALNEFLYKKCAQITLMKLTPKRNVICDGFPIFTGVEVPGEPEDEAEKHFKLYIKKMIILKILFERRHAYKR